MSGIHEPDNQVVSTGAQPGATSAIAGRVGGRDWRHLSTLFEQLPPHAIEAEMNVLGSMLIDPQVIGDVILVLRSGDDFYKPANGSIYEAMVELYDKHGAMDIVLLNQLLVDRDILSTVGGLNYLVELASAVPSAASALHHARLVRNKAAIRHLIDTAGDILYDAYHSSENALVILEAAEQRIFQIAQQSEQSHAVTMQELVYQAYDLISAADGEHLTGVPTGYHDLDEMTYGLQKGEMIIIAARPSMGKTALALNIAEQMALAGYPTGFFSLEMSKEQLVQRILSSRSRVDSKKLRRGMLNTDEDGSLQNACRELHDAPIYIDDTAGLTLLQMRAKARRLAAKHDIKALVVDYLQLMSAGGRVESRQMEISEISRGVKAMARELNIPVICLSQLNRAAEQREGHRPRMSDLRESGSLEQDADVVMMLHREEYYHQADPDWAEMNEEKLGVAELILAKQRNGPTGSVRLSWISEITRFENFSPAAPPGGYYGSGERYSTPATPPGPRNPRNPLAPRGGQGAPGSEPASGRFQKGAQTGPVSGFRDGGGPEPENADDIPF